MDQLLRKSLQPSTVKQYQAIWNNVRSFMNKELARDVCLPLDANTLGLYITWLYSLELKASTIRTHVSAISFVHKMRCLCDPTSVFYIRKLLKAVDRARPSYDRRLPISVSLLNGLLSVVQSCCDSSYEVVLYKAMMCTAYYACLRVGEIALSGNRENILNINQVAVSKSDGRMVSFEITFIDYKHSDGSFPKLQIREVLDKTFCPVKCLADYLSRRGKCSGALFVKSDNKLVLRNNFLMVLMRCFLLLHIPSDNFNTHSFRIGRCTDLAIQGFSTEQLRQIGRWRSDAFMVYVRPRVLVL